jgi:DNA-binding NtrC family response regulator
MAISVLLVDDEENFVETLAKRLTLRRFNIFTATRADQAFAALNEDLDGIAATKTIKGSHPLVEVILLTGHASIEASLEGMEMGAFDYLLKPVNIDELVYKIEDAHHKKELQEEKIRRLAEQTDEDGSVE